MPSIASLTSALKPLAQSKICVVTGAGVSLASGIPTFRGTDENAVWKRDITELGTYRYFREDPVGSWQWYLQRFNQLGDVRPNRAHYALADLEQWAGINRHDFLLVTQNIDTLHRQAGSQRLIEVHGRGDRVRCATAGCVNGAPHGSIARAEVPIDDFSTDPNADTVPRCRVCGDYLRQHVLWFDENYDEHKDYGWSSVLDAANTAELIIFVGTSFAVGVTELFLQQGISRQVPMYSIDPSANRPATDRLRVIRAKAEVALPELVQSLTDTQR